MKMSRLTLCLFLSVMVGSLCFASCGNSPKEKVVAPELTADNPDIDFDSFLAKFTSSAAFQYSRIKFPLKSAIVLSTADGLSEKSFPFTKDKWPLLDGEDLKEARVEQEGGGILVSKFVVKTNNHVEFESGYEESEIDLRVVFDLIEGKWYATDCITGWYSYNLTVNELPQTVKQVQEDNRNFIQDNP